MSSGSESAKLGLTQHSAALIPMYARRDSSLISCSRYSSDVARVVQRQEKTSFLTSKLLPFMSYNNCQPGRHISGQPFQAPDLHRRRPEMADRSPAPASLGLFSHITFPPWPTGAPAAASSLQECSATPPRDAELNGKNAARPSLLATGGRPTRRPAARSHPSPRFGAEREAGGHTGDAAV